MGDRDAAMNPIKTPGETASAETLREIAYRNDLLFAKLGNMN